MATDKEIEAEARRLYEERRKHVSGRPVWEKLNPSDQYDMGMREKAIQLAQQRLAD